jgi:predicted ATP-dependent endonuclease of OLD family
MIEKLIIQHFRSIKGIEVKLGEVNGFIGPNNAGKSNIMKALNMILGESYPSNRSFEENDFYNRDKSHPIKIEVKFKSPLNCDKRIVGFRLTFDGNTCEYVAIDENGRDIKKVSNEMRDEVSLMYLGLNRQAEQQIRPTSWTLYGKLLRHIDKKMDQDKKEKFIKEVRNSYESNIYLPTLREMEDHLCTYIKEQTGLDVYLRLSILDPVEILKNLRPYFKEKQNFQEFDAEDMGAGTQSALAVAIARAYSKIVKEPLILAIEEPELYLHPQGCRHFYKLLKELSEKGVQIIYTTHERSFVNLADFECIYLVRKESGETKIYYGREQKISDKKKIRLISHFDEQLNEIFFANQVVLVEGFTDKIACKLALEKLGVDLDKENISIVECSSKNSIKPISEVLRIFKIPTYVLLDEDPGNAETKKVISELQEFLGNDRVFIQQPNLEGMFGLSKKLSKAEAIEFFPEWFKNNTPPQVYENIKNKIKNQESIGDGLKKNSN